MISLSNKLIADYSELANQYLDSIPVEKEEDFGKIREALLSITKPNENHEVSPSLKDRVKKIEEILDPEMMYVKDPAHYGQFKAIILQRVAAKIQEIENLKPEEKIKYIENQRALKEKTAQNQATMAERKPPEVGSEAHVISTQEWLSQQQQLFQNQPVNQLPLESIQTMALLQVMQDQLNAINARGGNPTIREMFILQVLMSQHREMNRHVDSNRWFSNIGV